MISEERLKELVKQEATIYEVKYHHINPVKLTHEAEILGKAGYIKLKPRPNEQYLHHKYFKNLYETKGQAEWARDFQHIQRTEYLNLPSWEEVMRDLRNSKNGTYTIVENGVVTLNYKKDLITDQIFLYQNIYPYEQFNWNADKENYIKACEMAKRLFLGKEEQNNEEI